MRAIRLSALEDAPSAFGPTYEEESSFDEDAWRARAAGSAWFIAWHDDEPVGVIAGDADNTTSRYVSAMWVESGWRGSGTAVELIGAVKSWAKLDQATELLLVLADDNDRARRFYDRLGFTATGRRIPLPRDPSVQDDELRLRL